MLNNIKAIFRIAKMELNSMFYSPIAWLVLVIFAFQVGLTYANELDTYIHTQALGHGLYGATAGLFAMTKGIFPAITQYLYLYIPLITMGLMSKEYSTGSIKLLYSSPITNGSIVLGKFLAMMIYGFALSVIILIYFIFAVVVVDNVDWLPILTGLLGVYLLLCVYSAIGLFVSTLTSYQVVVAVGTLVVLGFLNFVGDMGQDIDFVRDITYWLSMTGRVQDMIKGLLSSEDVIYFFMIVIFFLILSVLVLDSQRVSNNRRNAGIKFVTLCVFVVMVGYVTSRPVNRYYVDATRIQKNTLSNQSIEVLKQLDGEVSITSYVNVIGGDSFLGLPRYKNADIDFFERYLRFKPDLKINYVYYYRKPDGVTYDKYPGKTDREVAEIMCDRSKINKKLLKSYEEISKDIDLSGENYNYVRVVENKNTGVRSFLRVYDDKEKLPKESEITVALKRLVAKSPLVTFVQGRTDRAVEIEGGRGFNMFSTRKLFRNSLVNQGFNTCAVNLENQDIPLETSILVIADLKSPMSEVELQKVNSYIAQGRNLYILADKDRQENMNTITSQLGVTFEKGVLIEQVQDLDPTLIPARITPEAAKLIPPFGGARHYVMIMPTCVGVNYDKVTDFAVTPLVTTSDYSWSEMVTNDFVEYTPECLESEGEVRRKYATVVALNRKFNDGEQRIVISGDADCVADQEFLTYRPFNKANYSLVTCPFMWLSNEQFPVLPYKDEPIDNSVSLPNSSRGIVKMLATSLPAAILLIIGLFIIIRRQRG